MFTICMLSAGSLTLFNGREKAHPDHISKEQLPAKIKDFIEVSNSCCAYYLIYKSRLRKNIGTYCKVVTNMEILCALYLEF